MKFSILIINYNGEKTVGRAIESALSQTYADIEVICVDDGSTDNSRDVYRKYESDSRFRLAVHEKNSGMVCGRQTGVDSATGDYCLFLDGDDELEADCCSTLADTVNSSAKTYDMIGFGVTPVYLIPMADEARAATEKFLEMKTGELCGNEIPKSIFEDRTVNHSIWNKCYKTEFVKKVGKYIKREYINLCEDYYFTFISSRLAESFFGIENKLIRYYIGEGISTCTGSVPMRTLVRNSESVYLAHRNCREFLSAEFPDDIYADCADSHERSVIFDFIVRATYLSDTEKKELAEILIDKFGRKQFICTMADYCMKNSKTAMNAFDISKFFPARKKAVKTVGLYYFRLRNGGTEKVIGKLSFILAEKGYNVIVITDEAKNGLDCEISPAAKRICFDTEASSECNGYGNRYDKWIECIGNNGIDLVIYNAHSYGCAPWDMAAIKSTGALFAAYIHSSFIAGLIDGWDGIISKQSAYKYADGIVTLSSADRIFWSRVNKNTFLVSNPVECADTEVLTAEKNSNKLLWVGRPDDSIKNPADAIHIFYRVVQKVPDAVLYMCGHADEAVRERLENECKALHVEDKVIFTGGLTDVTPHYRDATALFMTSDCEGFSLVITESLSYGTPVISYRLPYLETAKNSEAVISVEYRDFDKAAFEAIRLLKDTEYRNKKSLAAIEEANRFGRTDLGELWDSIIKSIADGSSVSDVTLPVSEVYELCDTADLAFRQTNGRITELYGYVRDYREKIVPDLSAKLWETEKELWETKQKLWESNQEAWKGNQELWEAQKSHAEREKNLTDTLNATAADYEELSHRISDVYNSKTYRLGQAILSIPMKIKKIFKK